MIIRNATKQYVTISRHHLSDVNLSLKAKGLLAQMLIWHRRTVIICQPNALCS